MQKNAAPNSWNCCAHWERCLRRPDGRIFGQHSARDWLRAQGAENVRIDSAKNVICKLGPDTEELVVLPPTRILCSQM